MSEATHGYVATCPDCGGWVMMCVDHEDDADDVAYAVAYAIKGGFPVERMLITEIRKFKCCERTCSWTKRRDHEDEEE